MSVDDYVKGKETRPCPINGDVMLRYAVVPLFYNCFGLTFYSHTLLNLDNGNHGTSQLLICVISI